MAASDENTYDMALATWRAFNSSVKAAVQQVNTHGYQQGEGRRDLLYGLIRPWASPLLAVRICMCTTTEALARRLASFP